MADYFNFLDLLKAANVKFVLCSGNELNVCDVNHSTYSIAWVFAFALVGFSLFVNRRNI